MNPLYEELIEAGLFRLPKGYSYRFHRRSFKESNWPYKDKVYVNPLRCSLRKHFLGIPFHVQGTYMSVNDLGNPYSPDNNEIRERNLATSEELYLKEWLPAHYAFLGTEAWELYEKRLTKKNAKKIEEDRQKAEDDIRINATRKYLGKGMP